MYFNVNELELRKIPFSVELPPGEIDFQDESIRQTSILRAEGVARLVSDTLGEIQIQGHLKVDMEADCDRCLEPTSVPIDEDFDLFYRAMSDDLGGHERAINAGEAEIGFYEGGGIELREILREHILLSFPMQQVCSEGCKGICPACGNNRNTSTCDCETKVADERWSALQQVKESLRTGRK